MSALRKPAKKTIQLNPPALMQAQLDTLALKLDALLAERETDAARADAYARYRTAGELALPMTAKQVAAVLSLSVQGVYWLQRQGFLARRWQACAGFHPDDVRTALRQQAPTAGRLPNLAQECNAGGGA